MNRGVEGSPAASRDDGGLRRDRRPRTVAAINTDPAFCQCPNPLLDTDIGAEGDGDDWDDFCWKCRRFLKDS